MKPLVMSAALLLNATLAEGNCTVVEVLQVQPSSQNARITVLKDGQPQKDLRLVVSTLEGQPQLSISTDSRGMVNLPDLPPGKYCIAASASPTLRADLCLNVSKNHRHKPSSFSMSLGIKPPPPPAFEEKLEAAEKAPVGIRTQIFAGIVQDPTGSVVPNVQAAVYRRGFDDKTHPLKISTDEQGRFSAALEPGTYTAVFQFAGFQTEFVTFEISPDGNKEDLRVILKLAMCT